MDVGREDEIQIALDCARNRLLVRTEIHGRVVVVELLLKANCASHQAMTARSVRVPTTAKAKAIQSMFAMSFPFEAVGIGPMPELCSRRGLDRVLSVEIDLCVLDSLGGRNGRAAHHAGTC